MNDAESRNCSTNLLVATTCRLWDATKILVTRFWYVAAAYLATAVLYLFTLSNRANIELVKGLGVHSEYFTQALSVLINPFFLLNLIASIVLFVIHMLLLCSTACDSPLRLVRVYLPFFVSQMVVLTGISIATFLVIQAPLAFVLDRPDLAGGVVEISRRVLIEPSMIVAFFMYFHGAHTIRDGFDCFKRAFTFVLHNLQYSLLYGLMYVLFTAGVMMGCYYVTTLSLFQNTVLLKLTTLVLMIVLQLKALFFFSFFVTVYLRQSNS